MPELRCRYIQLCKSVDIINGIFNCKLGASFILRIFLACFISYQITDCLPEAFSIATNVFWPRTCVLVLSTSSADVHDANLTNMDDKRKCCTIQMALRPLLMSMKLLGIYHDVIDNTNSITPSPALNAQKSRNWRKIFNSGTWSFLVVLLHWFNVIRFLVGLFPMDTGITNRINTLGFFAQSATNATVMFIACNRLTNMQAFIKYWNNLFDDSLTAKISIEQQFSKRHVMTVTAIAWMFFLLNIIGVSFLVNGTLNGTNAFRLSLVRPFPESTAVVIVCSILHVIETGAWLFPVAFMVTMAYTVRFNFESFSNVFERHINESVNGIPTDLQWFRSRHLKMCRAVAILDRMFMYLMTVCFGSNIFLACFALYAIVNRAMEPVFLTVHIFWLSASMCILLITAISSSQVSDAAHSPLEHILRIETRGATPEDMCQVNLFAMKLIGPKVGFTVLNMIVITKEVILTIGGAFVTYFFLLLQFKIN